MDSFELMVEQILLERSGTVIMYHGTEYKNLKSILRKGLLYKGVKHVWGSQYTGSFPNPSSKVYGGVYLTNNLQTAYNAITRVNNSGFLIVVCQIQPRTLFADEDDVTFILDGHNWGERLTTELYAGITAKEKTKFRNKYISDRLAWVDESLRLLAGLLSHPLKKPLAAHLRKLLMAGFPSVVRRKMSYLSPADYSWLPDKVPDPPNNISAESAFRKFISRITIAMKNVTRKEMAKNDYDIRGRLLDSIKFNGVNKIVCMFTIENGARIDSSGRWIRYIIKLHYGMLPSQTMNDLQTLFGDYTIEGTW